MIKQQYVLEVSPDRFAQPKFPSRSTSDLSEAEKFWSMESIVSFAHNYNYPSTAKIRLLKTEYLVDESWTVDEAQKKVESVFDNLLG